MIRTLNGLRAASAGLAALLACLGASAASAASCDRMCLRDMITRYVDAVVAHDPTNLPVAAKTRFTENSQDLKLGEGVWKTVTRKGDFRHDYLDVSRQVAAAHVLLYEGETPVLYSVLLRLQDRKIAGV